MTDFDPIAYRLYLAQARLDLSWADVIFDPTKHPRLAGKFTFVGKGEGVRFPGSASSSGSSSSHVFEVHGHPDIRDLHVRASSVDGKVEVSAHTHRGSTRSFVRMDKAQQEQFYKNLAEEMKGTKGMTADEIRQSMNDLGLQHDHLVDRQLPGQVKMVLDHVDQRISPKTFKPVKPKPAKTDQQVRDRLKTFSNGRGANHYGGYAGDVRTIQKLRNHALAAGL